MVRLLHLSTQFTCKVGTTSTLRISAELEPSAFDEKSGGGPVVSKAQYDRVWSYIESGKREGAKVLLGGEKRKEKGYWVDATSDHIFSP